MSPSRTVYVKFSIPVVSPLYGTYVALRSGPIAMYGIPPVVLTLTKSVLNPTVTTIDRPGNRTLEPPTSTVTFLTAGNVTSYTVNTLGKILGLPPSVTTRRSSESNPTAYVRVGLLNTNAGLPSGWSRPVARPSLVVSSWNTWNRLLPGSATAKRLPSLLNATSRGLDVADVFPNSPSSTPAMPMLLAEVLPMRNTELLGRSTGKPPSV